VAEPAEFEDAQTELKNALDVSHYSSSLMEPLTLHVQKCYVTFESATSSLSVEFSFMFHEMSHIGIGNMSHRNIFYLNTVTACDARPEVKIRVEVFWVVTPCGDMVKYQRFGRPFCLHPEGEFVFCVMTFYIGVVI
jgi:hypothetical protein